MSTSPAAEGQLQLLGEIETHFSPAATVDEAPWRASDRVSLVCERRSSIGVSDRHGEVLGRLSRRISGWLSVLIKEGYVHAEGCVPPARQCGHPDSRRMPLRLTIYLHDKGHSFLERRPTQSPAQALHEIVRRSYEDLQGCQEPAVVQEVCLSLQGFADRDLLPETRLLLALLPGLAREVESVRGVQSMAEFRRLLEAVQLGDPLHWRGVGIYPLSWPEYRPSPYLLLSEAIARKEAVVEEVSEQGSVPELLVKNRARRPVLIPEGEVLIGAKQNRVVNLTVLVPAKARLRLPVSCVEQGRWRFDRRGFEAGACAPPSLRLKKTRSVQRNRELHGTAASDQGEVWNEVARHLRNQEVDSATMSLADGFAARAKRLEEYQSHFPLPNGTCGVLVLCAGRVVALDLFDSPETFAALWDRLSRAYFFDALEWPVGSSLPNAEPVERFLERLASLARPKTAIGLGTELEINSAMLIGAALVYDSRLCHLAAFAEAH